MGIEVESPSPAMATTPSVDKATAKTAGKKGGKQ